MRSGVYTMPGRPVRSSCFGNTSPSPTVSRSTQAHHLFLADSSLHLPLPHHWTALHMYVNSWTAS